ncbi:MAG: type I methionyl aminopeptidase [Gammaproteobacteria bacterium]|nr:type I methionyl aminopeptidase [Gammaproteobacteria bacterium]
MRLTNVRVDLLVFTRHLCLRQALYNIETCKRQLFLTQFMAISLKTPAEIDKMRVAGALAASVLDMVGTHVRAGITTAELDKICHDYIVEELQATPAPLNYRGFPRSICTSVNHVVCHGIPGSKRLRNGDIMNIDITVIKDGYHGDTSKMFCVGQPSIRARRLVQTTRECLLLGIGMVRPGVRLGDIGHAIQSYAEARHFSVVREYCGHGIGKQFHEDPQVLHYGVPGTGITLEPGMTFTIEPMINAGKRHVKQLPDNWTVVTKDRSLSAQWEHTLLVTDDGHEVLTRRPEEEL